MGGHWGPYDPRPGAVMEHEYAVDEGDTFASIAERFGIDDWEDLWRHPPNQAALEAAGIASPDLLAKPVVLRIPDDPGLEACKAALKAHGVPLEKYLGGTSWLDPRALLSCTLLGSDGTPVADGTRVFVDGGDVHAVLLVEGGRVSRRLPRMAYTLRVELFPGFADACGWFPGLAPPGDAMASAVEPATPTRERPRGGAVAAVAAARAVDFEPMSTVPSARGRADQLAPVADLSAEDVVWDWSP